uniref:Uncharacterized protein n=1 Tax=Anguilla anguilla TaxID=7936 RepID=A0A0E9UBQ5_ANGAN
MDIHTQPLQPSPPITKHKPGPRCAFATQ